jgi:Ca-activated chloride channel family protein
MSKKIFRDRGWLGLPALLLLVASGCSSAEGTSDEALDGAGDTGGEDGLDDGGSGGMTGAPWDDGSQGGDEGGTSGAGADDDGGEPLPDPEEPEPMEEPPAECNSVDEVTLYLSPDDSNSMSSPVQAREAALDGFASVQSVPIRTWEFMNYYTFEYPAAEAGGVVVTPSLVAGAEAGSYTLQIGVSSEAVDTTARAPMNVTLVLDASGSMSGHPMDMLKETCRAIAASLKEGDTVSMVTWDTSNAIVLGGYTVDGPDDAMLLAEIDALEPGGGTDLNGGLTAGYMLAQQVYDAGRINRLVLISDGGANAGVTDIDLIAEHAGSSNGDGIYLVGVGVGTAGSYNDDLMDAVTDAGKGASVFVNDAPEAWKQFNDDFVSTMSVAVRDVQVRLDLPPGFEVVKFSGEEISGDPSEVEPQHLAPNDTMVFHQEIETCAPELVADDTPITVSVHYLDAVSFEARDAMVSTTFGELLAAESAQHLKGAAVFAYAESLKAYKKAFGADEGALAVSDALAALATAEAALPEDPDLAEIRAVLEAL